MSSGKWLHRDDAPFGSMVWKLIDETVMNVAKGQLGARKLLYIEGPYGLGMEYISGPQAKVESGKDEIEISADRGIPLAQIENAFKLPSRHLATYEETGVAFNREPLVKSVISSCEQEDAMVFYGAKELGISGLLNASGTQSMQLKPWDKVGDAIESIIAAVDKLDSSGFHGPYSLALTPDLYNRLFRIYPQANILEIEHIKSLVTDGVIKSASIKSGGVLVASGRQFASIVLGQDLSTGFEGPEGRDYVFTLSETVALRLTVPQSVCVLQAAK